MIPFRICAWFFIGLLIAAYNNASAAETIVITACLIMGSETGKHLSNLTVSFRRDG